MVGQNIDVSVVTTSPLPNFIQENSTTHMYSVAASIGGSIFTAWLVTVVTSCGQDLAIFWPRAATLLALYFLHNFMLLYRCTLCSFDSSSGILSSVSGVLYGESSYLSSFSFCVNWLHHSVPKPLKWAWGVFRFRFHSFYGPLLTLGSKLLWLAWVKIVLLKILVEFFYLLNNQDKCFLLPRNQRCPWLLR